MPGTGHVERYAEPDGQLVFDALRVDSVHGSIELAEAYVEVASWRKAAARRPAVGWQEHAVFGDGRPVEQRIGPHRPTAGGPDHVSITAAVHS